MRAAPPALAYERVSKAFPAGWGRLRVQALNDFSWTVAPGTICGLLGPNGSGKSTALAIALGLRTADHGHCLVGGVPAGSRAARAQVGYLRDDGGVQLHLTGREGLQWWGRLHGWSRRQAAERAEAVLADVGLREAADRQAATYSKGMRQRLGLAQALLPAPELLLLDEPFAGIDPRGVRELWAVLVRVRAQGRTVVLTSHLLDQVATQCDQIVLMASGRTLAADAPATILGPAAAVSPRRTLDDVFIALIEAGRTEANA